MTFGAFEDIPLEWAGRSYTLPPRGPRGRMAAGMKIEEVATLGEIATALHRGAVPHVRLCQAYSKLLQHVGATATGEDVMEWLGEAEDADEMQARLGSMVETIMGILSPPSALKGKTPAGADGPQENPPRKASSKAPSK